MRMRQQEGGSFAFAARRLFNFNVHLLVLALAFFLFSLPKKIFSYDYVFISAIFNQLSACIFLMCFCRCKILCRLYI